jgi:predicted nucleotidyltransferase
MKTLKTLPMVKGCQLYGSLASGTYDDFSDIDISVDVSGYDNSIFMLEIPELLCETPIYFYDFAPSLIPESYIVTLAIHTENPFRMVDIKCVGEPFCQTVTRDQIKNELIPHTLKLWVANMKHFLRGVDCRQDIIKMSNRIKISNANEKSGSELLKETLTWLEENQTENIAEFIRSCRSVSKTFL